MDYYNYIDVAAGLENEMKRPENKEYQWSFQLMIDHLYAQADALIRNPSNPD